ncbi:MAG: LPS export ABC transporter periplasmic protein LptC [Alphaproteobacteria bacterium]
MTSTETTPQPIPKAAARYSRRVKRLRRSMPLLAVIIIAAVIFWPEREAPDPFTLTQVEKEIEPDVLRMVNPQYSGMTRDGESFSVRADAARQAREDPARIELDAIAATYQSPSLGDVAIRATGGAFHTVDETLTLEGRIAFQSSTGYRLNAGALFVNFGEGWARSDAPVIADAPFGHITAAGFDVIDGGDKLHFRGPVRMVIDDDAVGTADSLLGKADERKLKDVQE